MSETPTPTTPPHSLGKPKPSFRERLVAFRGNLIYLAVLVCLLAPLAIGVGLFGIRQGMWGYELGQDFLALKAAPALAILGGALALLGLLMAVIIPPRKGAVVTLFAMVVAAVAYGGVWRWKASVANAPPIHDVATDWTDPLLFGATITSTRGLDANPAPAMPVIGELSAKPGYPIGKSIAEINAATCPAAVPVVATVSVKEAYAKTRAALLAEKLALVTENPVAGRIEATGTTKWYGYKDDVIARIKPAGAGAQIDLRASRRTGVSDYGDNCARVTRLRARLSK